VGGAPHSGDPPAQELEFFNDFLSSSGILMVVHVEVKGVDCGLVVDADEYCRVWQSGSEQGGDFFLHSV